MANGPETKPPSTNAVVPSFNNVRLLPEDVAARFRNAFRPNTSVISPGTLPPRGQFGLNPADPFGLSGTNNPVVAQAPAAPNTATPAANTTPAAGSSFVAPQQQNNVVGNSLTNLNNPVTPDEVLAKLLAKFPMPTDSSKIAKFSAPLGAEALSRALDAGSQGELSHDDRIAVKRLLRTQGAALAKLFSLPGEAQVFNSLMAGAGFGRIAVLNNSPGGNNGAGNFNVGNNSSQGPSTKVKVVGAIGGALQVAANVFGNNNNGSSWGTNNNQQGGFGGFINNLFGRNNG